MTPDAWLLREKGRLIRGPFTATEIKKMIVGGELVAQSEICVANGYWVGLHEADEVEKLLGVRVPVQVGQVEANFHEDKTDPLEPAQLQELEKESVPETTSFLMRSGERLSVIPASAVDAAPVAEKKRSPLLVLLGLLLIALILLVVLYYVRAIN